MKGTTENAFRVVADQYPTVLPGPAVTYISEITEINLINGQDKFIQ